VLRSSAEPNRDDSSSSTWLITHCLIVLGVLNLPGSARRRTGQTLSFLPLARAGGSTSSVQNGVDELSNADLEPGGLSGLDEVPHEVTAEGSEQQSGEQVGIDVRSGLGQ
jgi:hypothetical protein